MRCGSNCEIHCRPAEAAEDRARLHEAYGHDDLARIVRLSLRDAHGVLAFLAGSQPEVVERAMAYMDHLHKTRTERAT